MSVLPLLACFAVGLVSGVTNVLAAGGSFLTLPTLLFLGLPATIANGTNRVGVLMQNLTAVWTFNRHGMVPWSWAAKAAIPALIGAGFGVWAALSIPEVAFRRLLSTVILVMTVVTLVQKARGAGARDEALLPPTHLGMVLSFFATGFYGGFLQAGVGFLFLTVTSTAGFDLVRGNAIKVLMVLLVTVLSLIVFAGAGQVDWRLGMALGLGNLVGGSFGARLAVSKGHRWLERVVAFAAIAFAILLWVTE